MKIEHIAILVQDLEGIKEFYSRHFHAQAGEKYHNPQKGFTSYFLSFPKDGARLEIMSRKDVGASVDSSEVFGLAHFALSVGTEEAVREKTEELRAAGVTITGEPRWTGDGYYESLIHDPEGNILEITI